jgi:hypothetical protein
LRHVREEGNDRNNAEWEGATRMAEVDVMVSSASDLMVDVKWPAKKAAVLPIREYSSQQPITPMEVVWRLDLKCLQEKACN